MNMKKIILLVIVFATLLSLANVFAANPRTVMQLVQYANGTQPPYTVGPLTLRAWFAERPTEILTSIANPTLVKFQNLTTAPAGTYASVNCSGFASAWSTAGGEHLTLEITDTQHGNVMVTTIIVTPSGSALIKITTPIFIPWPVVTTTLVPAENPTPATGAPGVAVATSQVSWTYPVNAETITPAVGYRVKFGTASDLAGVSAVYVTGTTFYITCSCIQYNVLLASCSNRCKFKKECTQDRCIKLPNLELPYRVRSTTTEHDLPNRTRSIRLSCKQSIEYNWHWLQRNNQCTRNLGIW